MARCDVLVFIQKSNYFVYSPWEDANASWQGILSRNMPAVHLICKVPDGSEIYQYFSLLP
jgi:hypothetical protein